MSDYTALILVGLATAVLGFAAAIGMLSLNFGSHKKEQYPQKIWRTANSRAGLSLAVCGSLLAGSAAIAGSDAPRLDNYFGAFACASLIVPLIGFRSAFKLLGESRRHRYSGGQSG